MFRDLALMLIVFCLAAFPAEKIVRANDDNDLIEERQPVYDVDPINIEPRNVAADIDNWVYGVDRNGTRGAELSLSSQLQRRVNMLARSMSLSEGQIDQLSLAGQGDIRRFMDRVDEVKARFGHARRGPDTWRAILQECRPLRDDFRRGVFAEPSLFSKMTARIMTVEQIRQSKKVVRERRLFHHQAGVHMTVLRLSTALGLSGEQQTQLKKLLLQETRPAHPRWGESRRVFQRRLRTAASHSRAEAAAAVRALAMAGPESEAGISPGCQRRKSRIGRRRRR